MNPILAFLFSCVLPPAFFALVAALFYRLKEEKRGFITEETPLVIPKKEKRKGRMAVRILLLAAVGLNLFQWFSPMLDGFYARIEFLRTTQVSAHRGSKRRTPENTAAAVEAAIEDLADYAEIDIQMSLDGVLVLMHDDLLKRTTGAQGEVAGLSWAELSTLDAGAWFGEEFTGERIPTLEEIMELADGRMGGLS